MKLPDKISKTLSQTGYALFPPPGYLSIEDTDDGGGDDFGLYWEIGKEANYPIVCASRHEESLLIPEFRDFESFNEWFDETEGQGSTDINLADSDFFLPLMIKGKLLTKKGNNAEAIEKLERSVSLFGEYFESWYWLAENYYITGQKEKADRSIVNCFASNFFFGFPTKNAVDRFNEMKPSDDMQKHPIIKRRTGLITGGNFLTPLSVNYDALLNMVEDLKQEGEYRMAMLIKQNFGLLMMYETEATWKNYGFDRLKWSDQFKEELFSFYPARKY